MPKYNLRRSGENTRVNKGKCASEVTFDILDQCVEDKIQDCDEEIQTKTDEEVPKIDTRTFDEIMVVTFEEFNSKSSRIRSNALNIICSQLQLTHNPTFLKEHIDRIVNIVEIAMQSDVPCELNLAASLISLVAIQVPDCSMRLYYAPLKDSLQNKNLRSSVQSDVCYAMGILTFLHEANSNRILTVMEVFEDYFVYDCNYITSSEANRNSQFQVAAFETWTFLMTLLPSNLEGSRTLTIKSVESVLSLLESPCFNMRVASAKAMAVILECGFAKKYLESNLTRIIRKVSAIVSAWNKHSSDIKSTPEVLQYLEKGVTPCREIPNGKGVLNLNSWALTVRYEMLCNVFGSANVVKHLCKNAKLLKKLKMGLSTNAPTFSPKAEDAPPSCDPIRFIPAPFQTNLYDFENLLKNLEYATHKSPMERTKALEEICDELQNKVVPHTFLDDQKNVILDIILKAMKRGSDTEQLAVVRLATLNVLQFGRDERFCSEISKLFYNSLKNSSASISTNAAICTALAFFELADDEHSTNVPSEPVLNVLRQIFSESHPHHKTLMEGSSNEQSSLLRIKALEAWGLLLTLCSPKDVCSMVKGQIVKDLTEMLHTSNAEFRIVCGQVISLVIEQGRIHDGGYLKSDIPEVCNVIQDIVTDRRSIGRDKRMMQNTKLREVLKYLENGSHSPFMLRFHEEIHELKTWSSLFKYQKLSQVMGSNLATHLSQNARIRCIISIGPKPVSLPLDRKPNLQHKLGCAAKKKSKTKEYRVSKSTPKFDYV